MQSDSGDPVSPKRNLRLVVMSGVAMLLATLWVGSGTARAALQQISRFLSLQGEPERASANVLSEHETEGLDQMSPQSQAELLLERSLNHYKGANDQIAERVDKWRGAITLNDRLNSLFKTALNSSDLRVRAAAIEVDLAAKNFEKTSATVDRLEPDARSGEQGPRANALWFIGLLASRGVEQERAVRILLAAIHDSNENIRYWAVEGLSYVGTDETIAPLLEVFRYDPLPMIRERAACGLAQSGMLSEKQRRTAVPKLLDYAADPALDPETRKWVYQALRDITGQNLAHDPTVWRDWYTSGNQQWNPTTRDRQ